ncbi:hypothetical protein HQ35_01365 [Porphyromonas cangingivalis]|uniref:Uncharacterized protein n=1 Tax=Porphyromonas cangingivalis TaxID=36874 RepID=A0A0A2EVG0_PORCN|nr:hypothetical protein [Porphyromonas cangingivalis]KGN82888.1 hypothetical protein HQ35_01365 [Porphyromonas cangingivalis]
MKQEERKRQHLDFIQGAITRMASNSFQIKGFTVAIVAILGSLYSTMNSLFCIISAILMTVLFALMDAYYFQLERKYRKLYDRKVKAMDEEEDCDYKMAVNDIEFQYCRALFSKSLIFPYVPLLLLLIGGLLVIAFVPCARGC